MRSRDEAIEVLTKLFRNERLRVYKNSFQVCDSTSLIMINLEGEKYIVAAGEGDLFEELKGEMTASGYKLSPLTHENRLILNRFFEWTVPAALGKDTATIGLGDRLGLASAAHIMSLAGRAVKPVLAQQSKREMDLTGRSLDDVLDDVSFAVFREGYKGGFGADGDHLKTKDEVEAALSAGYSMITLDCFDQVKPLANLGNIDLESSYRTLPEEKRRYYEETYLDKSYPVGSLQVLMDERDYLVNVLLYHPVVEQVEKIYRDCLLPAGREIDYEISLDETLSPTSLTGHFFVARELQQRNIPIVSMAPRYVGEFEKGIDYIGDLDEFSRYVQEHAELAKHFGYRLSFHSGSDKFSTYEIINKWTGGKFHLKTSGTSWLEAVKVIIEVNPQLYRKMHHYAFKRFHEATSYYRVTADISKIEDITKLSDEDLKSLMNDRNARQLIHITFGILLQAQENGRHLFREEIYRTLKEHEEDYEKALVKHIGHHLDLLGFKRDLPSGEV
jgi:hypothetical protein